LAVFKFVISQGSKSYQLEKEQAECEALIGKKIGEKFSGDLIGLNGYELEITGGSDKDGFPMRGDIEGTVRKRLIVTKGIGFKGFKRIGKKKYKIKGLRKRKMIRGNTIANDIVQINCKVVKTGEKTLDELIPKKSKGEEKTETESGEKKKEGKEEKAKTEESKENGKKE